jgi:hypothetical protein
MLKRIAMLAATAALALVPVSAAEASRPSQPQPLELCKVKWVLPPNTQTILQQGQSSMPQTDSFDVENPYAHSGNASNDGTVEHDDLTYDGC